MYILTIYRLIDYLDIAYQCASEHEQDVKAAALAWIQEYGWEPEARQSLDEQFESLLVWANHSGEGDDYHTVLRNADE